MLVSGYINAGYYELMPSTIYGFLKFALIANWVIGDDGQIPQFEYPLFYVEGERVLCVHSYPSKLVCNNGTTIKVGIGLDRGRKVTGEGYLYMEELLDLQLVAMKVKR